MPITGPLAVTGPGESQATGGGPSTTGKEQGSGRFGGDEPGFRPPPAKWNAPALLQQGERGRSSLRGARSSYIRGLGGFTHWSSHAIIS